MTMNTNEHMARRCKNKHEQSFIYLFDKCFTPYSGICDLHDGGQRYTDERKPGSAKESSTAIPTLHEDRVS